MLFSFYQRKVLESDCAAVRNSSACTITVGETITRRQKYEQVGKGDISTKGSVQDGITARLCQRRTYEFTAVIMAPSHLLSWYAHL